MKANQAINRKEKGIENWNKNTATGRKVKSRCREQAETRAREMERY